MTKKTLKAGNESSTKKVVKKPTQKTASKSTEPFKTHCYNCEDETNQTKLFEDQKLGPREVVWRNEEGDDSQSMWEVVMEVWTVSRCLGCEKLNFKHRTVNGPIRENDQIFFFPRKPIRKPPQWIVKLPMRYAVVFQEVYIALNEGLFMLTLTGIRTLLDVFIVSKIGDAGTFKQKLTKLVEYGVITATKATVLGTAIDAGNASAHRAYRPEKETVFQVLDIVEHLLHSEIVDRHADLIKKNTPPRT